MKWATVFLTLSVFAGAAYSDQFRIVHEKETGNYDVSYSRVIVYDRNGNSVFSGYTDKYGRINVEIPSGTYVLSVLYGKTWMGARISIMGSNALRRIAVR